MARFAPASPRNVEVALDDAGAADPRDAVIDAILAYLQEDPAYEKAKLAVQEEILKPECEAGKVQDILGKVLRASGHGVALKTLAFQRLLQGRRQGRQVERLAGPVGTPLPPLPVPASAESLGIVDWARQRWAQLLAKRLQDLALEQRQPVLRRRSPLPSRTAGTALGGAGSAGAWSDGEVATRPIVDIDRLYRLVTVEMAARPRSPGGAGTSVTPDADRGVAIPGQLPAWSALGVQFRADSLESLRCQYAEMSPEQEHLGISDPRRCAGEAEISERRLAEAQTLLAEGYPPALRAFARCGVPPAARQDVWARCLGAAPNTGAASLQQLSRGVCDWEWLTDDVLRLDVAENCANDVNFFPFDELVESLCLALSRDASVPADCSGGMVHPPIVAASSAEEQEPSSSAAPELVPPCGVVPFRGFTNYACPFAFLTDRLEAAYPLFRAFYCRHLCRLHTLSSEPATLLSLCALFESLVFTSAPHVGYHLAQLGPEAAPLKFAFPWIVSGFVGFLRADQVLLLWDRILGYESVQLLAVLAAAIVAFRSRLLLSAKTPEDLELAFADLASVQALALLQTFLFANGLMDGASRP